jgi:GTPase SAR1 family protein
MSRATTDHPTRLRVVVVGPCASGKSTLVERLTAAGFDAYVCSQEHSEIATLWQHLGPDAVIALDVDLATIRARRGADWPDTIYQEQRRRLAAAWRAANIIIDTSITSAEETLALARHALRQRESHAEELGPPG